MTEYFSYYEIDQLLQSHMSMRSDFFHHQNYHDLIQKLVGIPKELVVKVLDGAFLFSQITRDDVNDNVINRVLATLDKLDVESLSNYGDALNSFRFSGMDKNLYELLCDQINNEMMKKHTGVNIDFVDLSVDFLSNADRIVNTYSTLKKSMKVELLDELFLNCSRRMKSFWQKVEPKNFKDVVDTLTTSFGDDSFSHQELVDLSQKCATIFCDSTREKILGVNKILEDYKNYCIKIAERIPEFNNDELKKLKDFNVTQIFRKTSSITKANNRTVYHTSEFLKGKSIGEIFSHKIYNKDLKYQLYYKYRDAQINLSCDDLIWVLTKNPTILSGSLTTTLDFLDRVEDSLKKNYPELKKEKFNATCLLTRNNFLRGMPKNVDGENINKNIELLSCFMNKDEVVDYLKNDMNIFSIDYNKLRDIVVNVFVKNRKSDDLIKDLNSILKGEVSSFINSENEVYREQNKAKTQNKNKENTLIFPDIKLALDKIKDYAFDFDLEKLKLLLGNHYESFVSDLQDSGVDKTRLNDVIDRQLPNFIKPDTKESINISSLKSFIVSGYGDQKLNKIELLWQLFRNITLADELTKKSINTNNLEEKADRLYICSTNYFKLAREKDLVFGQIENIDSHYKNSLKTISERVESSFEQLTEDFAKLCKNNRVFLDTYIDDLTKQKDIIEQKIEELFVKDDTVNNIEERRQQIILKLEKREEIYKLESEKLKILNKEISEMSLEMATERTLDNKQENTRVGEDVDKQEDFLHLVYVSEKERQLQVELNNKQKEKAFTEGQIYAYIEQIQQLRKELKSLDKNTRRLEIAKSIEERLKLLESKLKYAEEVKNRIK